MGSPSLTGTITLHDAMQGIRVYNQLLLQNGQELVKQLSQAALTPENIERYRNGLRKTKADAAPFHAMLDDDLLVYMQSQRPKYKGNALDDCTATIAAADATDTYITAVMEKNASGKLGTTFPESALPGLKTNVEALIATIS